MNRELRKIRKWLAANRLALNIEKTNYVIFHSPNRKISEPISIKIGRKRIKEENTVKFLGVSSNVLHPRAIVPLMCSTSLLTILWKNLMETILWKFWYGPRLLSYYE